MSREIHLVQGLSAAGSFFQAMRPGAGELLVNEDLLSCGPLPPFRSFDQWTSVRQAFWNSVSPDTGPPMSEYEGSLLLNTATLSDAESITVWLGTGIAEQLMLAWLIQVLRALHSKAKVSAAQFSLWGDRNAEVLAVGMLNPEQIKRHPPIEAIPGDTTAELDRCWQAITSPHPSALVSLLGTEHENTRYLRKGLQSLVLRYPSDKTGLGVWDQELLKHVHGQGPSVIRAIAHVLSENIGTDLVGDGYLLWRLRELANPVLKQPLVNLSGDASNMRSCQAVLTDAGRAVLQGNTNAVELNGIDDWVLGVHLSSQRGAVWYQKDGTLVAA